ncbi:putative protein phosphatase 2c 55, partial [Quercus suber]
RSTFPRTVQKPQAQGEEAHFILVEKNAIGVAEGVGSWAKYGVDVGEYARQLMRNALIAIHNQRPPNGVVKLREALEEAFQKTMASVSSTACIVTFKDYYLHSINVGDNVARLAGQERLGGKRDDITVIVGHVLA